MSRVVNSRERFFKKAPLKEALGIVGLLFIAFFTWVGVAGAYFGLTLVLVSLLLHWRQPDFRFFWRQPVTLLFVSLALYVGVWECVIQATLPLQKSGFCSCFPGVAICYIALPE